MKDHKITLDDPRLTAYALGELEDSTDRVRIEAAVSQDPALKDYVNEIRSLGETLKGEFANEDAPSLERSIKDSGSGAVSAPEKQSRRATWRYVIPLGIAASLAVVTTLHFDFLGTESSVEAQIVEHANPQPVPTTTPLEVKKGQVDAARLRMLETAGVSHNLESLGEFSKEDLNQDGSMLGVPKPTPVASATTDQESKRVGQTGYDQDAMESDPNLFAFNGSLAPSEEMLEEFQMNYDEATKERQRGQESLAPIPAKIAGGVLKAASSGLTPDRLSIGDPDLTSTELAALSLPQSDSDHSSLGELADAASFDTDASSRDARFGSGFGVGGRGTTANRSLDRFASEYDGIQPDHRRGGTASRRVKKKALHAPRPPHNTESYAAIVDQRFKSIVNPGDERTTFSTDVDTASYANVRRFLTQSQIPPADAVRVEEMINYFDYAYENPNEEQPFSVNLEVNEAPWKANHRLLRIALKARDVTVDKRPDSNLVFLVDVSGSMRPFNKLPLLKRCLIKMVDGLTERDMISLVVYSGESRVVLQPTPGSDKTRIISAIDSLGAGSGTNGEAGIRAAYELAKKHALANGVNRILLATDGDFNVGVTNTSQLIAMAKDHAKKDHIFLTVLGFGEDNVKDDRMEQLANKVDGSYHYIDSELEGNKVLINQMSATLVPMAKDVKIQVEFNPAKVKQYRLIGYANRQLKNRDFADDTKDAGEMGAGHTVTAFYEIIPTGVPAWTPGEAPLKYRTPPQPQPEEKDAAFGIIESDELVTVRLRYKEPKGEASKLLEFTTKDEGSLWSDASEDFRFATAVAAFGMRLRNSQYCSASLAQVKQWAGNAMTRDEFGYRREFVNLIDHARRLCGEE